MKQNKCTILSAEVDERSGEFKGKDGELIEFTTRKQKAKYEDGDGFVYPLDVRLEEGQKPWPVGEYTIDFAGMTTVNKGVMNYSKYHRLVPVPAGK